MKDKVYSDPVELRAELQTIADKLNLPINDERVGSAWLDEKGDAQSTTKEVMEEVLVPLYFSHCKKKN